MRRQRWFGIAVLAGAMAACDPTPPAEVDTTFGARGHVCAPSEFAFDGATRVPRFARAGDCGRFAAFLAEHTVERLLRNTVGFGEPTFGGDRGAVEDSAGGPAEGSADQPDRFTGTNVQEVGIDEPDTVKTSGDVTFAIAGGRVEVLRTWPPEQAARLATLGDDSGADGWPMALMLHGDRLAVIGQAPWEYAVVDDGATVDVEIGGSSGGDGVVAMTTLIAPRPFAPATRIRLYDVSDPAHPLPVRTVDLEVWYQDARLIEGRLIVTGGRHLGLPDVMAPLTPAFEDAAGTPSAAEVERLRTAVYEAVAATRYRDWLPLMRDSLTGEEALMVERPEGLWLPNVPGTGGVFGIVSISLEEDDEPLRSGLLLADGGVLYARGRSLYSAYTNRQWWWGAAAEPAVWDMGNPDAGWETTIQKFTLDDHGRPDYAGAGTAPGWISSPFQMSEHEGYLRVALTDAAANHLVVLGPRENGDLATAGAVYGFAPDETIFSSRFLGDRGFVSTYHQALLFDPFFTFDLSDPQRPRLVGELEMPGYTDYLHPVAADHLLGVGMDAPAMGEPVTAVNLQIYDVTDLAAPVTTAEAVIGVENGMTLSAVQGSHHAFTFDADLGVFAFPVYGWSADWSREEQWLYVYAVAPPDVLEPRGRIGHAALGDAWYAAIERSIIMQGDGEAWIYAFSPAGMTVHALADPGSPLVTIVYPSWMPGAGETKPGSDAGAAGPN